MKKLYLITSLSLGVFFSSNAQLLIDENFDYGSSNGDLVALSGGNWTNHSGTTTVQYVNTSLSMASYPNSGVGGSALVDGTRSEDVNRTFTAQTSGVIYASALLNIASASTTENYFMHFMSGTTIFYSRLMAKDDGAGNLKLGIVETNTGTITYSTSNYAYNTTYLVVIKYDYTAGAASLFVLNSVVGSEPSASAVSSDGTDATSLNAIGLRQSANIPLANIDGLRVANTWADLMTGAASPTVNFSSATVTKSESSGTSTITINISPAPVSSETIDVTIADNTATYSSDYTTTPAGTSTFTLNVGSGATSVSFDVTVIDDATQESTEDFTATISAVSSGLTLGSTDVLTFSITDNDSPITITPIKDVQATTSGDASDMVGQSVTVTGIVSAVKSGSGFFIQDAVGAWNGIYIYDAGSNTVVRGDSILLTGTVAEFAPGGTETATQITSLTSFTNIGAKTPYASFSLSTNAVNAEMYEGVLVSVTSAITKSSPDSFGEWLVNDNSGNVTIDDFLYTVTPTPIVNDIYDITGVVGHNFGAYKILPRDVADVTKTGTHLAITDENKLNLSIYPNPSNGIINIEYIGQIDVKAYDAQGKLVLTTTKKNFELSKGIYSIVVTTREGQAIERLIVE